LTTPYLKTVERKVSTLIPVFVGGDSASLTALFECDSMNRVLMKSFEEEKGHKTGSTLKFGGGVLDYRTKTKPDTVYVKSDTIETRTEVPVYIEVAKEVNKLTKWQKLRLTIGDITIVLLAVYAVMWLVKQKLKIF
jgi:hypothetical protein